MASSELSPACVQGSASPHIAGGAVYDISSVQGELLWVLGPGSLISLCEMLVRKVSVGGA